MARVETCDTLPAGVAAATAGAIPLPAVARLTEAARGPATTPHLLLRPGILDAPSNALRAALRPALKRAMDLAGAGLLLLACLPVFIAIALLVRRDGGPVFYAHPRVGRGGRMFGCLKFRSMVVDADRRLADLLACDPAALAEWQETRKLKRDPRVTAVGRLLRATSLDELPQLFNVLRGEMSLVGPRPVQAAELEQHYGPAAAHYLAVRPGITGPWQVSGRNDTTYGMRVALDVAYATTPSLWTDLRILARTPVAVLARRGAY
jgi:lipopolysaccharide/colanic/teichoic acid biosynthesis glycosyltransferase